MNHSINNMNNMNNKDNMNTRSSSLSALKVQDRRNLVQMSRSLRRLKRKMFLQAVEEPITPMDNLRYVLLSVASLQSGYDSCSSLDASSSDLINGSDSSLSAIQEE